MTLLQAIVEPIADGEEKIIKVLGGKGINTPFEEFVVDGLNFNITIEVNFW